jgi:deoxyribose-phosphate aldolase
MKSVISAVPGSITKIKASGGIRTLEQTMDLISAGADRIGASATISIIAELSGGAAESKRGY